MQPSEIRTLFFSPTGTTRRITGAIAQAAADGSPIVATDLTHAKAPALTFGPDTVALLAAPVYGGHIPPLAFERLAEIRGNDTPAIIAVVYGNRDFGKAAVELAEFARRHGFRPIAAATFVGEHSYSSSDCRRTSRRRRHGRRNRIRRKHPGQTARRTTCNRRRCPAENTPNAPALPAAIYPFRAGLSAPTAQKSGCTHPRRRRRTLHPMRPLRSTLPDASHRTRRRTAHRPAALHPLLRLRQRLPDRSSELRNALCRCPGPQFLPAQAARHPAMKTTSIERLARPTAAELDALTA